MKFMCKNIFKNSIDFNINKKKCADAADKPKAISYFQLFRYATVCEKLLTIVGGGLVSLASMGTPGFVTIFGEMMQLYVDRTKEGVDMITTPTTSIHVINLFGGAAVLVNGSHADNMEALRNDVVAHGICIVTIILVQIVLCCIGVDMINYSALKQVTRIRQLFLQSYLRQDMAWHDTSNGPNFASRVTEDLEKLKEGIADKLAVYIYYVSIFVYCMCVAFWFGWKLTLVALSGVPLMAFSTKVMAKIQSAMSTKEANASEKGSAMVEEVLSSIKTVIAFGGERKEIARYASELEKTNAAGRLQGIFQSLGSGLRWLGLYSTYGLSFWYGVKLLLADRYSNEPDYTPAVLMTLFLSVPMAARHLGNALTYISVFANAKGAAVAIFHVIERKSLVVTHGMLPDFIKGSVHVKNVHFEYPSRPGLSVLKGFTLNVEAGQTVALVGPSGSGKSTVLQLLQRLYEPTKGSICFDNLNISDVNLKRLRSFIGVVGQEPVLFSCSIGDNVRYGKPSATQEEIEEVCKISNCHEFIMKLPKGYATLVGESGGKLSGGQKQRIAIARSLIRNPSVLLLDEATSALDPVSERQVQNASDIASKGRTTIVVAHRLSTITNADKIVYVDDGRVIEEGTHAELMERRGRYYDLVDANNSQQDIQETKLGDVNSKSFSEMALETAYDIVEMENKETINDLEPKQESKENQATFWRIFRLNAPEWKYIAVGIISAILFGMSISMYAVLIGQLTHTFSIPDESVVRQESYRLAMYLVLLGFTVGLLSFLYAFTFDVAGIRLTTRLRKRVFSHILKQEMGWFDDARNGVGILCARLSGDCASIQRACGPRLGTIIGSLTTLIGGILIAFYHSWKLTIVGVIPISFLVVIHHIESRMTVKGSLNEKLALEQACQIAVEAISSIKTVASLGQESDVLKRYLEELATAERECRNKLKYRGIVFALSHTLHYLGIGLMITVGGSMIANGEIMYYVVNVITNALVVGGLRLSFSLSHVPNINVAVLSAGRLLKMLDRVPKYGPSEPKPLNSQDKDGTVRFDNATFTYPTRDTEPVLKSLSLRVPPGKTVALVGSSGCGKSTCVQLLLRYYDLDSGTIELNGKPNTNYTLESLRQEIGLVSQEPILFDRTIAENIAYGDNCRIISMPEIIEAARKANVHEFVMALPSGFETRMGFKGGQFSGGQKQRVAIARALIRNPKILLLDEATSALDVQSEGVVQAALDAARYGRTCIIIAHRLSNVRNADLICVIEGGAVREKGTHDQLMQLGKIYRTLYEMQEVH